ncbi:MAG: AMP-binding protein [Candidatus Lokiarchaeota archaeon]|nr:AMP-binding protein [Candidatus Lokiarchaeota archaeon]
MSQNPYAEKPWLEHYDKHVPIHIDYPEINIYNFLDEAASDFGRNTAIWFMGKKVSYKDFKNIADRLGTALYELGVRKGDAIAILMPNMPQFLFSFYGIMKAGGIVTALSVLHTEHELAYQLNDCGAETIIAWDNQLQKINKIKERTRLRNIIITNILDYSPNPPTSPPEIAGTTQFLTLIRNTKPKLPSFNTNAKEDIAILQYTGGTTGLPKGAMLTHYNIVSNCVAVNKWVESETERGKDTTLTNLPLFHIYGMTVCMNAPIYNASTIALNPDPRDHKSLFEAIKATQPALFPGVPTMYMRLLERDDLEDYAKYLKSIRVCNTGAAPMPPEVLKEFEERTGGKILEGFGMTETSPVTHSNPINGKRKIGSVGLAFPDTEIKLVDIDDYTKIVPIGERGELMIKGPQVMKGYWNKPEETENQLKDGWILTGDIAKLDEDGYLFIVDRKKDMVNVSGFKVYPREIEDLLFEHEAVESAAIIGLPNPELQGSEIVKAYVVLKGEYRESEEIKADIKKFASDNLAPYKVPKIIEFRKELPETLVGKVQRKDLRDREAMKRGDEVY